MRRMSILVGLSILLAAPAFGKWCMYCTMWDLCSTPCYNHLTGLGSQCGAGWICAISCSRCNPELQCTDPCERYGAITTCGAVGGPGITCEDTTCDQPGACGTCTSDPEQVIAQECYWDDWSGHYAITVTYGVATTCTDPHQCPNCGPYPQCNPQRTESWDTLHSSYEGCCSMGPDSRGCGSWCP